MSAAGVELAEAASSWRVLLTGRIITTVSWTLTASDLVLKTSIAAVLVGERLAQSGFLLLW